MIAALSHIAAKVEGGRFAVVARVDATLFFAKRLAIICAVLGVFEALACLFLCAAKASTEALLFLGAVRLNAISKAKGTAAFFVRLAARISTKTCTVFGSRLLASQDIAFVELRPTQAGRTRTTNCEPLGTTRGRGLFVVLTAGKVRTRTGGVAAGNRFGINLCKLFLRSDTGVCVFYRLSRAR